MENINPQFTYYISAYVLTILLRFIRAYNSKPKHPVDEYYWKNYFHFGFELVNVFAGIVILLSEYLPTYFATFMIIYLILIIVSFFCENPTTDDNLKLIGHTGTSLAVISLTIYTFYGAGNIKYSNPDSEKKYKVNLTYIDTSMNRLLAAKNTVIKSSYSIETNSKNRQDALNKAKVIFYSENGPLPFVYKTEKGPATMIVLENESVVEQLNK